MLMNSQLIKIVAIQVHCLSYSSLSTCSVVRTCQCHALTYFEHGFQESAKMQAK